MEELEDNQGVAIFSKLRWYHRFIYSDFIEVQFQLRLFKINSVVVRTVYATINRGYLIGSPVGADFSVYNKYLTKLYQQDSNPYQTVRSGWCIWCCKKL